MSRFLTTMANAILPHQCLQCRQFTDGRGLCGTCWQGLVPISEPLCSVCGRPLPHPLPEGKCGQCWLVPPPVDQVRAWCLYNDMSRALILKFKHGDGLMLTPVFASALSRLYSTLATPDSLVIPTPLYRWRYVFRRYNQAAELARRLACTHQDGIYAPDILHRKKATSSQAGLNRLQRRRNLAGAFAIDPSARPRLQNKPIMLVDDVMTTGATLFEAARTLRHAGSGAVTAVIIARVG